nr:PKD domain-containing protein [Candidatus Sigynarchaeota archaeon]
MQPNNFAPVLSSPGVSPGSGTQLTSFNFTVTYSDADNNIPEYMDLVVDGMHFAMNKQNPGDINFIDGAGFSIGIYLQAGAHNYHFECSDWLHTASTSSTALTVNPAANTHAPILYMAQATPLYGFNGITGFTFRVTYSDADNNQPSYVRLVLNSTIYAMTKEYPSDTDYMGGCWYILTLIINVTGTYTYQFTCSDGTFTASTTTYTGLAVTSRPPLYFDGMVYNYTCYNEVSGTQLNQSVRITSAGGTRYFLNSTPDAWPIWEDRYIMDISREITDDLWTDYRPGTHDWVRIYTDIGWGSLVSLSTRQEGDQVFGVITEDYIREMGRTFHCFALESARGSIAYYDIYSGLLVLGYFVSEPGGPGMDKYYLIEITGTNVPLEPNTHAPVLSSPKVIPAGGNQNTLLNFSVVYTDQDNNYPENVNVVINGTTYPMTQVHPFDRNYVDGCTFNYLTYLGPAKYNYQFTGADFAFLASTPVYTNLTITSTNALTPQLLSPGVTPSTGINTTLFNFTVTYLDGDNNLPVSINVTINATIYTMIAVDMSDTNVMDGKLYCYAGTLAYGMYQYRINCSDGIHASQTSWISGPNVNPMLPFLNITLFYDDFEGGLANWSTIDGFWHLTDTSSAWSDPCHSPTHAMWFGREYFGTYAASGRSVGDLISVPIDLSITPKAYIQFHQWRIADGGQDTSSVYVTTNGGLTWFQVYQTWTTPINPWERPVFNISDYCGNKSVQFKFNFDTRDAWNNNFRGWYVDDVMIYSQYADINPVAAFTANVTTILRTRWVQFTFTGAEGNPPASFEWNFNDGSPISNDRNPVHQFNTAGSFTITLLVRDFDGDTSFLSMPNYITVNPNQLPVANFAVNTTTIGIGQSILFTFTGSDGDVPASFQWYFGDGTPNGTARNPTHQYIAAGDFTVSLKVIDSNGDTSYLRRAAYIHVIDYLPVANFTANSTQINPGQWVQFNFTGTDGNVPSSFQWNFGDGPTNSTTRNPTHQYAGIGVYTVILTITDFDGDRSTMRKTNYISVVVDLTPVANFAVNTTTIYQNQWIQFFFTGSEGDAPATFNWSFGDGTVNSTLRNPVHQYTTLGNFTVTLWIKDFNGDTDIKIITNFIHVINRLPIANFTANTTNIRVGNSVSFTFTGSDGDTPCTFQWNFTDGTANSTDRSPVHQFDILGNYSVFLTVLDSNGDRSTMKKMNYITVVVNLIPVPDFSVNASTISQNQWILFTFTGSEGDPPAIFEWLFGDGTSNSSLRNPVHQYSVTGDFSVTLMVQDDDGDTRYLHRNNYIHVKLVPFANFTANATIIGRERWVQFTYTGTNGTPSPTFQWSFGDGTANSTDTNPKHKYGSTIGSYTVIVTVRDGDGDIDVERRTAYIQVVNLVPVASFVANETAIYEGDWVQFTFTGFEGDAPAIFQWDFGDNGSSTAKNPMHRYMIQGSYHVTLTLLDRYLEFVFTIRANYINVVSDVNPVANFTANTTTIIAGQEIQFTFTGSQGNAPATYQWYFDDGTSNDTRQNPVHAFTTPGMRIIILTTIDSDGDTDTEVKIDYITVLDDLQPVANFMGNATTISIGDQVQFTYTGTLGNNPHVFQWSFGDGTSNSTDMNPLHAFARSGSYTITLTIVDADGDTSTKQIISYIMVKSSDVLQQIIDFITENWIIVIAAVAGIVIISAAAVAARRKKSIAKAQLAKAKGKSTEGYREPEAKPQLTHAQIIAKLKHLFVFHRNTSACLMYMAFTEKHFDPQLIAGFISAITSFGGTFDEKAKLRVLDYQGFKILMEETEYCRHALLFEGDLNDQVSDLFNQFIMEFEAKYGSQLASFRGDLTPYASSGDVIQKVFQVEGESLAAQVQTKPTPVQRPTKPVATTQQQAAATPQPAQTQPAQVQQHLYCGTCQKWIDITAGQQITGDEKCDACGQPLYIVLGCKKCGNSIVRYGSEFNAFTKTPPPCEKCGNPMSIQ